MTLFINVVHHNRTAAQKYINKKDSDKERKQHERPRRQKQIYPPTYVYVCMCMRLCVCVCVCVCVCIRTCVHVCMYESVYVNDIIRIVEVVLCDVPYLIYILYIYIYKNLYYC